MREKRARSLGLTLLVGYNIVQGLLMLLILLLIAIQSDLSIVNWIASLIVYDLPFPASIVGNFLLAYGLWRRKNWAWWLTIILALVGVFVFWVNIPVGILVLLDLQTGRALLSVLISYLANYMVIIFYLIRPHVKAIFNVKPSPIHKLAQARLSFIDFARGIVMVLMAWDHVSTFWNPGRRGSEGLLTFVGESAIRLRPEFPNSAQFILRFVTHWCAPTFIFLAGTALALSVVRRLARGESQKDITLRIIKRGAVLLLLEALVIAPLFFYNGPVPYLYFGVLACIGVSLIIFSFLRRIPPVAILAISVLIILGQSFLINSLTPTTPVGEFNWYLKVILYQPNFELMPYVGLYPIIPWIGVMGLGWCFGIFLTSYNRKRVAQLVPSIAAVGGAAIALWFVVRLVNSFGNILPRLGNTSNIIQDWLLMGKYPPSLAFLLWTLGGMCFFLVLGLILQNRPNFTRGITGIILTFGKVPLFFYVTHIVLYKFWVSYPGLNRPTSFQTNLVGTAIFWVIGLVILWRLCLWYEKLKRSHPDSVLKYI